MARPTVFLDVDEVICIGQPQACLELARALKNGELASQHLATLFSPVARNALAVAHRRSPGVRYVISSTWRIHFTREQMVSILDGAGFYFVAANLHEGDAWRCAPPGGGRDREAEILEWLDAYHKGEPFAVVDDSHSGGKLLLANGPPGGRLNGRVVVCKPGVGVTLEHVDFLVDALTRPV